MAYIEYIESTNIQVFPYGNDRVADPYGRVLNEQNLRKIIRTANYKDSYVISYDDTLKKIEFVISGYHFTAILPNSLLTGTDAIFANIKLETVIENGVSYEYLAGGDASGEFQGCTFGDKQTGTDWHALKILSYDESSKTYKVPLGCYKNYIVINCGDSNF